MSDKPLMSLDEIRDRLDLGDTQMLEWLATRANLVREVARIKEAKGASLQAADREASMFARKQIQCRVLGLDFHYVAELVSLMIWHSKQIECDELGRDTFLDTQPVPPERLHAQLLELTAAEAPRYDEYCRGEDADAVSSYIDRELDWIDAAAGEAPDRDLALDLGCATGQVAEFLQSRFERVRGFDVSPAMIDHARARCDWSPGVEFEVRDLDGGIPAGDGTVSFAAANFGAASELAADLPRELARVLRPGGTALLSWYNRNALVNDWFYPWPATVHSHLNPHNDTLEVWSGGSVYTIRARAMTVDEARGACESAGLEFRVAGTYPTLQPILPAFVARSPRARALYDTCRQLDDHLASPGIDKGSCIIAVVARPSGSAPGAGAPRPAGPAVAGRFAYIRSRGEGMRGRRDRLPLAGSRSDPVRENEVAMPALASDEIVTVVDGENRPVAELPRHRVRSENLAHRATYIFVFDRRGSVLVQRRTAIKDVCPGWYDLAAGGVVAAGESYEGCAEREAEEELGIRGAALERKFDFYYKDERIRCFGRVFTCLHEGPFTLQPEEVESAAFRTVDEIRAGRISPLTPDTLLALEHLLSLEPGGGIPVNATRND